jgi:hypothetical protein
VSACIRPADDSKYHYVSIRPALRIEAERLNDYGDSSG